VGAGSVVVGVVGAGSGVVGAGSGVVGSVGVGSVVAMGVDGAGSGVVVGVVGVGSVAVGAVGAGVDVETGGLRLTRYRVKKLSEVCATVKELAVKRASASMGSLRGIDISYMAHLLSHCENC